MKCNEVLGFWEEYSKKRLAQEIEGEIRRHLKYCVPCQENYTGKS